MEKISERVDALVCDMDGVVYKGDASVPGAAAAIQRLRDAGVCVLFCTNNSAAGVEDYRVKLARLGIPAGPGDILTSAVVAAEFVLRELGSDASVYVVGGSGLRETMSAAGATLLDGEEARSASAVVVGWDRTFDWDKMRIAATAVRAGAALYATNGDTTFPSADGLWPGAGAILASIEAASNKRAVVLGKPHEPMMDVARQRLQGAGRIGVVGDRYDTDIAAGLAMGWTTVLVLSGVTEVGEVAGLDPAPDVVVGSIADLA